MRACFVMCPSVPGNIYYIYPHHHTQFKIITLELIFQTTNYDLDRVRKYMNLHPVSYISLYSAFLTFKFLQSMFVQKIE
jgi:hypothetical protein